MKADVVDLVCCLAIWIVPMTAMIIFGLSDRRRSRTQAFGAENGNEVITLRRAARLRR